MFLEKLEIQGFKSFANKNVLVFPGMLGGDKRGITAVVGPNGSGKSNVADSVRWALGEQSMKTLRGKRSEDVIFSGSDKKGKLGMSEVSLYLNNEDNSAPIEYSQVVLTRRLFRDGDSEYLINNNRVRLADIQMLLAKAKFGQKTYSVIGQGTVEGFLNTSLAERKEFFDEATGVKQYQIKRDDALNKLRLSFENLLQAEMLLTEIEPRLKSLTRQVNRLRKRDELDQELKTWQTDYYRQIWHEINDKFTEYNNRFLELEKVKLAKEKKQEQLTKEMNQLKIDSQEDQPALGWQNDLYRRQTEKEEIGRRLAKIEAQLELKLETSGQFDLSFLMNKKEELLAEIGAVGEEIAGLQKNIANDAAQGEELRFAKEKIDQETTELNQKLIRISVGADKESLRKLDSRIRALDEKIKKMKTEDEIEKIRAILAETEAIVAEILELAKGLGGAENDLPGLEASLTKLNLAKEASINRIHENNLRLSARSERAKLLKEKEQSLSKELGGVETKIKQRSSQFDFAELTNEQNRLKEEIKICDERVQEIRDRLEQAGVEAGTKRKKLFVLQQSLQDGQNEINQLSNELNDLKINSTRYETKLEDLETEVRQELGSLKDIKPTRLEKTINIDEYKDKIAQLKHQLELIGGIDPQIEKEYEETKTRFDFLSGQVEDFTKAVDSLQKIIKELDVNIKERFDREFREIEKKFEEYFKILFNGGHAKIIKVMEEEMAEEEPEEPAPAEGSPVGEKKEVKKEPPELRRIKYLQKYNATGLAGIEIQATPPGKKIKSITMLSGGERALTAIALICAIISSNPSPFVFLDEVDASLDEANSERLAKILDELSHKTQFIVITHNRASMRKANVLYGITMGDDGVSKLLSVKLDEVKTDN